MVMKTEYSHKEIANILGTSTATVSRLVDEDELLKQGRSTASEGFLETEKLDRFFKNYVREKKIDATLFEVPDSLRGVDTKWANTLIGMYEEPFSLGSVTPNQGEIIRNIVLEFRPEVVVEIGCFIGASSIWMASALNEIGEDSILHSVDLFNPIFPQAPKSWGYLQDPLEYARKSAASAGLGERIHFHKMNSNRMGKEYDRHIDRNANLLYIDGDHHICGCIADFVLFYPHVNVGGHIVLHDIYPEHCGWKGPRYLIDKFLLNSDSVEIEEIPTIPNYGMAVIKKLRHDERFAPGGSMALNMHRFVHHVMQKTIRLANWDKLKYTGFGKGLKKALPFWPFR